MRNYRSWVRSHPNALCQDDAVLSTITEFDYDLSNKAFRSYLTHRGLIHVTGEPGSKRETYLSDYRLTKGSYLSDAYFQFAKEVDGKRYRFTDREMEIGWEIILLSRARIQDCWEVWIASKQT
jgi:hypothetical protein